MHIDDTEANLADVGTTAPAEPEITPEAEAVETTETEESLESDELQSLMKEATGAEEEANPEEVEVEYDGETFKLPAKLKDALLRHSDYTKKTMEVAEQRKAVDAIKQEVETFRTLSQNQFEAALQYQQAEAKRQALLNTPTDGLTVEEINALRLDFADVSRETEQLANYLTQLTQVEQQARAQQIAKAREDAVKAAAKEIPNFTDERRTALEALAADIGKISREDLGEITHPGVYKLLHLADIGNKFIQSQRKAAKATQAQASAPVPEVGGKKAAASKDPNRMTPEEYHAYRMKQRMG